LFFCVLQLRMRSIIGFEERRLQLRPIAYDYDLEETFSPYFGLVDARLS